MEYSLSYRLGGFTGKAFSPLDLSPALWLDAESLSGADGTDIATWIDKSGNGRNATQGTALNQPKLYNSVINGKKVARFDGIDDFLEVNSMSSFFSGNDTPISIIAVAKSNIITDFGVVIVAFSTTTLQRHPFRLGNAFRYSRNDGSVTKTADGNTADTNWNIHSVICTGTTATVATNGTIYDNNEDVDVGALTLDAVRIGSITGLAPVTLDGDIAEILVFPAAISTTNRQRVERYLGNKYAITVA